MNHNQNDEDQFGDSKSVREIGSSFDAIETRDEPMNAQKTIETDDDGTRNCLGIAEEAGSDEVQVGRKDAEQVQLEVYAANVIAQKTLGIANEQSLFEVRFGESKKERERVS
jgi:hypothetical protein